MLISRLLKTGWAARAGWLGVVVALLLVTHPELRALLLLPRELMRSAAAQLAWLGLVSVRASAR